jgi:hypothetical protein
MYSLSVRAVAKVSRLFETSVYILNGEEYRLSHSVQCCSLRIHRRRMRILDGTIRSIGTVGPHTDCLLLADAYSHLPVHPHLHDLTLSSLLIGSYVILIQLAICVISRIGGRLRR